MSATTRSPSSAVLLSVRQVAELLSLSVPTIRRHVRDGILPSLKIGGAVRVRAKDLETVLRTARTPRSK